MDPDQAPLLESGLEVLVDMGFRPQVSPLVSLDVARWWAAATPAETAAELNRLLRDPEVRAIFALSGGRMTMSYLDLIDLDAVRADPKPMLGFSDISALHLALNARTGLVTIHSELVTYGFGTWHELEPAHRTSLANAYRQLLTSEEPLGELPKAGEWERWRGGTADGPLIGGLLNRIVRNQATPFGLTERQSQGAILFWEEVGTTFPGVWTDLQALRVGGLLDRIGGMVVGRASGVEPADVGPRDLRDLVLDVLGARDIPVIGNVDIGHDAANLPLPLGVRAAVDADARTLSLLEPAVRVR